MAISLGCVAATFLISTISSRPILRQNVYYLLAIVFHPMGTFRKNLIEPAIPLHFRLTRFFCMVAVHVVAQIALCRQVSIALLLVSALGVIHGFAHHNTPTELADIDSLTPPPFFSVSAPLRSLSS